MSPYCLPLSYSRSMILFAFSLLIRITGIPETILKLNICRAIFCRAPRIFFSSWNSYCTVYLEWILFGIHLFTTRSCINLSKFLESPFFFITEARKMSRVPGTVGWIAFDLVMQTGDSRVNRHLLNYLLPYLVTY